jgi:aspartate carbamoyltransferase catalytic subunit
MGRVWQGVWGAVMVRHLVTIDDLSDGEILNIFALADEFLAKMGDPEKQWRVVGRLPLAQDFILETLFYEPSTRTRFSFESAMTRLGGHVLSSADPKTTSAAKGETIADTVRVLQNYADLIVIRHPCEGAVKVAAEYADVPIINAGDGGHEHPTQTLCDLYTLQREKGTLKNLNVLLWGDLKNGRTVHSLVYGLARFGARIIPMPAEGYDLPDHVKRRLLRDYDCEPVTKERLGNEGSGEGTTDEFPVDVVYVTPEKPHQRSLFSDVKEKGTDVLRVRLPHNALSKIDACYVTRLQKERMSGETSADSYPVVDTAFLNNRRYRQSSVMHPLPRVTELGYDLDNDERAVYFKQASYGVPVRMALISALLNLKPDILGAEPPKKRHAHYTRRTVACDNPQCVTALETEQRYLTPKFLVIIEDERLTARCQYCEHESVPEFVGRSSTRKYEPNRMRWETLPDDIMLFPDEASAVAAGFQPYKQKVKV